MTLNGPLTGSELMYIVSPGNAAQGNSYGITTAVLANFFGSFRSLNTETLTAGATSGSPYQVETTDSIILFGKTLGSPSYAVLPLAATMASAASILFKDIKGDAATNNITISFSSGQLCDGLSEVQITNAFGWVRIAPVITPILGGSQWYEC
jgi:hypothetical protein